MALARTYCQLHAAFADPRRRPTGNRSHAWCRGHRHSQRGRVHSAGQQWGLHVIAHCAARPGHCKPSCGGAWRTAHLAWLRACTDRTSHLQSHCLGTDSFVYADDPQPRPCSRMLAARWRIERRLTGGLCVPGGQLLAGRLAPSRRFWNKNHACVGPIECIWALGRLFFLRCPSRELPRLRSCLIQRILRSGSHAQAKRCHRTTS